MNIGKRSVRHVTEKRSLSCMIASPECWTEWWSVIVQSISQTFQQTSKQQSSREMSSQKLPGKTQQTQYEGTVLQGKKFNYWKNFSKKFRSRFDIITWQYVNTNMKCMVIMAFKIWDCNFGKKIVWCKKYILRFS